MESGLFDYLNPVVQGLGLAGGGLLLAGLGLVREMNRFPPRRSRLRLPGLALVVCGLAWGGWYLVAVDPFEEMALTPHGEIPEAFEFVTAVYEGDRECRRLTSRFCQYGLAQALPGVRATCIFDTADIEGSWAEGIADIPGIEVDRDDLLILRGDVIPQPLLGTCRLKVSRANVRLRSEGLFVQGRFRCDPETLCR